jgi:predicted PurR-regulated permease PerM
LKIGELGVSFNVHKKLEILNSHMTEKRNIEKYLGYGAVVLIGLGCLAVLKPFISALLWAAIICYTTWPIFQFVKRFTKGRNAVSAVIMTFLVALFFLIPLILLAVALAENISKLDEIKMVFKNEILPSIPAWIKKIPFAGQFLAEKWEDSSPDTGLILAYLKDFIISTHAWFFRRIFDMGSAILQISLSVLACFFFYKDGEIFARILDETVHRIAGTFRHHVIETVDNTIRGVVYGIVGTALWQGVAAGFGFWLAGVPSAFLLGFITFILSPIPAGPPIVWISASLWLFNHGLIGWGIFMILWGAISVSSVDNVIRTYLISKNAKIPFILIFLGVIGGILYFGFIGIFLGPVLLAIGYNLLKEFYAKNNFASSVNKNIEI